jgi:hypothetical protein
MIDMYASLSKSARLKHEVVQGVTALASICDHLVLGSAPEHALVAESGSGKRCKVTSQLLAYNVNRWTHGLVLAG